MNTRMRKKELTSIRPRSRSMIQRIQRKSSISR
jgi:hypothetical protein